MSPFVSKGVNSCARDIVFSGSMLTIFILGREAEEASLQCFTCGCKLGQWAREAWGCAGGQQKGGLVSSSAESLEVLFGSNFMGFLFLQQTFKQQRYPLTEVCFDFSLLSKSVLGSLWGEGKQLQPTSDTPALDTRTKRLRDFPHASPLLLSVDRRVAPAPGEVPCVGVLLCWVEQWPCAGSWSHSLWSFVGVLWLFSLDHLTAAVFNELEKK